MTTKQPALLLDIDGVLNSVASCVALGGLPDPLEVKDTAQFLSPIAVGLLKWIVSNTNCEVVLISSWRKFVTVEQLQSYFPVHTALPNGPKKERVQEWINDNPERRYCILEDAKIDLDMDSMFGTYVLVSSNDGLNWNAAVDTYLALGGKSDDVPLVLL